MQGSVECLSHVKCIGIETYGPETGGVGGRCCDSNCDTNECIPISATTDIFNDSAG